uniref:Transposase n=1 Tax=Heterorhabditis bacteriophora TaxID=37862 RepID=A0A1I7X622_HETBA
MKKVADVLWPLTTTNRGPLLKRSHATQLERLDKWVPHELNGYQKNRRYEICSALLLRNKNDPFLDRIVTWRKMDSIREPMAFCPVGGPR